MTITTTSAALAGTYPFTVTGTTTAVTGTGTLVISPAAPTARTWVGGTSTDWNTAANWNPVGVPGAGDDVTIPTGSTRQPFISTTSNTFALANNVSIQSGETLTLGQGGTFVGSATFSGNLTNAGTLVIGFASSSLAVAGNLDNTSGTMTFTAGTVNVGGVFTRGSFTTASPGTFFVYQSAGAQTIAPITYGNLQLSGGGTKTAGGDVTVVNTFTVDAGTTFSALATTEHYQGSVVINGVYSGGRVRRASRAAPPLRASAAPGSPMSTPSGT